MGKLLDQVVLGIWDKKFHEVLKANPVLSQFKSCFISAELDNIEWNVDVVSIQYEKLTPEFVQKARGLGKVCLTWPNF
jgi:hypothetical protein